MLNIPRLNLYDLIGREVMTRSPYQWVKIFGLQNCISLNPVVIDRDYIRREACDCVATGRTSNAMANIMLKFYAEWSTRNEQIVGIVAETLHNEIMDAISKAYRIAWLAGESKNPHTRVMKYFNRIKSNHFYYYLMNTEGKKNHGKASVARKMQANRVFMLCSGSICTISDSDLIEANVSNPTFWEEHRAKFNSADFDWDNLTVKTPEEIYMACYT